MKAIHSAVAIKALAEARLEEIAPTEFNPRSFLDNPALDRAHLQAIIADCERVLELAMRPLEDWTITPYSLARTEHGFPPPAVWRQASAAEIAEALDAMIERIALGMEA